MSKQQQRSQETSEKASNDGTIHASITHDPLDVSSALNKVKDPSAGAVVMFAGTTRDTFDSKAVASLTYEAYVPLALSSFLRIGEAAQKTHGLVKVNIIHRLGEVPVGEESILICVSAPHRTAAWRGGEAILEEVKSSAEVWKLERFVGESGGYWRSNADGASGVWVDDPNAAK